MKLDTTLLLTCYGQERYISDALRSALAQTYQPLRIIVSDDCSADRTFAIVEEIASSYDGPHELQIRRNPTNVFLGEVFPWGSIETEFCVLAQGDDICSPDRVEKSVAALRDTDLSAVSTNAIIIDENGHESGLHESIEAPKDCSLDAFVHDGAIATCFGAGLAWRKDVFEHFGPLPKGPRNIDIQIPFRAALLRGCGYINEPLVKWRHHSGNRSLHKIAERSQTEAERLLADDRYLCNRVANTNAMISTLQGFQPPNGQDRTGAVAKRTAYMQQLLRFQLAMTQDWVLLRDRMAKQRIGLA